MILLRPVSKEFKISSPFGKTRIIDGKINVHKGVDFACPVNTPIRACADGRVQRSGWENPSNPKQGFGMRVMQRILIDNITYFAFYGHCNSLDVQEGDDIKTGQIIAHSGNTGSSTGPHLHFGLRRSDSAEWIGCEFFDPEEDKPELKAIV